MMLPMLAVGALLVAACGSGTSAGDDPPELDGRQFWSTSVAENGAERELVEGTQIQISFADGNVSASAGCNSMGGAYSLDGDVLVVSDMFSTEIGCDPDRHDQDMFVSAFLTSGPTVALDGDLLTLSGESVTIDFADLSGQTESLIGPRWEVTGFIDGQAATSFSVDEPAFLVFEADTMTGFDGCDEIAAPVEISDGSTGGPVAGDGELQFGQLEVLDPVAECIDAEYREQVREVLTGEASYTIENAGPGVSNLTIANRSGLSMTLKNR